MPYLADNEDRGRKKQAARRERRRNHWVFIGTIMLLFIVVFAGFLFTGNPSQTVPEKKPLNPPPTEPEFQDTATIVNERVNRIGGVEEASVLVLNRIVLIALVLDSNLSRQGVDAIKKEAVGTAADLPQVDEVLVTANPEIFAEVGDILAGEAPLDSLQDIYERIRDEMVF